MEIPRKVRQDLKIVLVDKMGELLLEALLPLPETPAPIRRAREKDGSERRRAGCQAQAQPDPQAGRDTASPHAHTGLTVSPTAVLSHSTQAVR